ncbi:hypothetical protein CI1B_25930 [Bradyrhizobium ivorense]|uniref:Uncharacterized protein n=1 Tax=Bradyrhizobium ivorense TaxID=2511166 RepID=A0A508T4B6_9BRAD|nr:hypothetical protein [Bradyrhizobium ivorense]VIO69128.1 hypothetical protein CI41S_17740 [Bradyrhizobium ivorense]VIO69270.1 hypothetical protein CI1B_25930 [Bradyrhizobium ivorense]
MDAEGAVPEEGTGWTAEQVAIVVANYFLMLERVAGRRENQAMRITVWSRSNSSFNPQPKRPDAY